MCRYIPPISSCPQGYLPTFDDLRDARGDLLLVGDFNAHHPSWYSRTEDDRATARGESLDAAVSGSELCFLNKDTPTRLPSSGPSLLLLLLFAIKGAVRHHGVQQGDPGR